MGSHSEWHVPFHQDSLTLQACLDSLGNVYAELETPPLMIQLQETLVTRLSCFELFQQTVDRHQHDCIHIMLGRGLARIDEAFTIGFTLGSSRKLTTTEQNLYAQVSRYIYPDTYRFSEEEMMVFKDAIRLAYISACTSLAGFDFTVWLDHPVARIREAIGLEPELLTAYFAVEKRRFPTNKASARLLPEPQRVIAF